MTVERDLGPSGDQHRRDSSLIMMSQARLVAPICVHDVDLVRSTGRAAVCIKRSSCRPGDQAGSGSLAGWPSDASYRSRQRVHHVDLGLAVHGRSRRRSSFRPQTTMARLSLADVGCRLAASPATAKGVARCNDPVVVSPVPSVRDLPVLPREGGIPGRRGGQKHQREDDYTACPECSSPSPTMLPTLPPARAGKPHSLDLVALQQLLADHHALDLGRSLADQQQRRVAV